MMMNLPSFSKFILLFSPFLVISCNLKDNNTALGGSSAANELSVCDPAGYDLSCMKDEKTAVSDEILDVLGGAKDAAVGALGKPVSDARQDEYGDGSRPDIEAEFPVMPQHEDQTMLEGILLKLLRQRPHPSKIDYHIRIVRASMVNAFTIGGEIYVTDQMLAQAQNKDELACVIGHEIGHNELGHLAKQIQQTELAQGILGDENGVLADNLVSMLTIGFNQKSEAEADIYGIDLALSAGYNACRGIDFWKREEAMDNAADELDNLMRSHPYSARRANCYRSHLADFHQLQCQN